MIQGVQGVKSDKHLYIFVFQVVLPGFEGLLVTFVSIQIFSIETKNHVFYAVLIFGFHVSWVTFSAIFIFKWNNLIPNSNLCF